MGKAPSFQFYPSDWLRDLAEHPLEISGAWITICCHLFYSETKGTADKTIENWSRILREKEKKTVQIIAYLDNHNIASVVKQKDGIQITSRRMVYDEYIRKTRHLAGLQGGNPLLKNLSEKGNLSKNLLNQNTLSSSSSSSSSSKNIKHKWGEFGHVLLTEEEYSKLEAVVGLDLGRWIKTVDEGIEQKGYKYKNHYLTILKWREKEKKNATDNRSFHERNADKNERSRREVRSLLGVSGGSAGLDSTTDKDSIGTKRTITGDGETCYIPEVEDTKD